ncbi:MAG: hypothetical protein QG635_546 [Bacteroidota bacterium]|nr:hypothetical protein [Bacteroidota bacterium]
MKYKQETFIDYDETTLELTNLEERRNKFVYLWALIPLTRAIDTIIITISDSNSIISRKLREIANELPDVIEWID